MATLAKTCTDNSHQKAFSSLPHGQAMLYYAQQLNSVQYPSQSVSQCHSNVREVPNRLTASKPKKRGKPVLPKFVRSTAPEFFHGTQVRRKAFIAVGTKINEIRIANLEKSLHKRYINTYLKRYYHWIFIINVTSEPVRYKSYQILESDWTKPSSFPIPRRFFRMLLDFYHSDRPKPSFAQIWRRKWD